ncbi:hypothetical protein RJ639_046452 [Escallonia herrerae]|uniref:Subtilisin-like protease fibronectin type-III domain-containing protein n=1 Tax=Escallonia herrerae TaxID=1293975 RepID=A0AA88WAH2_9ASTE|nr:hypothetical protein RJ639_046452 [Escallonia herrerae]
MVAWRMYATKNQEAEFAYGAGHIDPVKATNPGLVYDTLKDDYIQMLCNLKYDDRTIRTDGTAKDLNQPSVTAQVKVKPFKVEFRRTVTNVVAASSTYKATVSKPPQLSVSVEPSSLSFKSLNEKKSFVVNVSGNDLESMASASLVWSDGTHSVQSPVVLYPDTKIHFP